MNSPGLTAHDTPGLLSFTQMNLLKLGPTNRCAQSSVDLVKTTARSGRELADPYFFISAQEFHNLHR
jgi:hypothetical protein